MTGTLGMGQSLNSIIEQIERLDSDERLLIEQRLRELAEGEWQAEAQNARTSASEQGVTQQAIDDAVDRLRYGS